MTFERIWICEIEQSNAVAATRHPDVTRDAVAEFYADCVMANVFDPNEDSSYL